MFHLYLSVSSQICFVNLDPQKTDCHDDKIIKVSRIHVPLLFYGSLLREPLFFPTHFSSPRNSVYCISHTNIDSVAMDSKSLPKIRGLICLDNMQISQPPAAGGGTGGRSIIVPQGSGVLTEKKRRVQNLFFLFYNLALCLCSPCLLQKLASVSPDLPKLVELLTVHQPKENEILLLGGLEASDTCQTHPHAPSQVSAQRCLEILASMFSLWINWPGVRGRECKLFFRTAIFLWLDLDLSCEERSTRGSAFILLSNSPPFTPIKKKLLVFWGKELRVGPRTKYLHVEKITLAGSNGWLDEKRFILEYF